MKTDEIVDSIEIVEMKKSPVSTRFLAYAGNKAG
jgi:hypothetical protein